MRQKDIGPLKFMKEVVTLSKISRLKDSAIFTFGQPSFLFTMKSSCIEKVRIGLNLM